MCARCFLVALIGIVGLAVVEATPAMAQFSRATFVGESKRCPPGTHFSPRKDGQCWACPNGMKRTPLAKITGPRACRKPKAVAWRPAILRKAQVWPKACRKGEFWHILGGKLLKGGCYSCPAGYYIKAIKPNPNTACKRVVPARHAKARFVAEHGCRKGALYKFKLGGGTCWTCPKGWFPTINRLDGPKACSKKLAGVFAADVSGICRVAIDAVGKGIKAAETTGGVISRFTEPAIKPVRAALAKLPSIKSPAKLKKMVANVAKALKPYEPQVREMRRVAGILSGNPKRFQKLLLDKDLMCSGDGPRLRRALVRAGLPSFRRRKAGLFNELVVGNAHANDRQAFRAIYLSWGIKGPFNTFGKTVTFTLIQSDDQKAWLYISGGFFAAKGIGQDFSLGVLMFPDAHKGDFAKITNLGAQLSAAASSPIVKPLYSPEWDAGLAVEVSFDPGSLAKANMRGKAIGASVGMSSNSDGKRDFSRSLSTDWSFRIKTF